MGIPTYKIRPLTFICGETIHPTITINTATIVGLKKIGPTTPWFSKNATQWVQKYKTKIDDTKYLHPIAILN